MESRQSRDLSVNGKKLVIRQPNDKKITSVMRKKSFFFNFVSESRNSAERGRSHQPFTFGIGQCHQCFGRTKNKTCQFQRFEINQVNFSGI